MNEGTQLGTENSVERPAPVRNQPKKSKTLLVIVALVVVALLAALVLKYTNNGPLATGDGVIDPSTVVASVNGIDITRGELDKKINQIKSTLPAGSADPATDAAFELQLLDEVINLKLLLVTAQSKGFTVSTDQVEQEIATLVERLGGETAFQQQLTENQLTIDELRENMANELVIRQLIDQDTAIKGVAVTNEEIQSTYDEAMGGAPEGQDVPAIGEVSEMIKAQLLQQKSAEIVQGYIDTLREGAQIEILL